MTDALPQSAIVKRRINRVGSSIEPLEPRTLLSAAPINVPATANIFGAGLSAAPAPGGGSGGVLPSVFTFNARAGNVVTFPSVAGTASITPPEARVGGDGGHTFSTNISSFGGISGIEDAGTLGFLVGVFLGPTAPVSPAPAALNFTGNTGFASLSPLIGQTFFIGDGLTGTGSGSVQKFNAPPTATRLFLGFADGNNIQGPPGEYQDNAGSLSVTPALPSGLAVNIDGTRIVRKGSKAPLSQIFGAEQVSVPITVTNDDPTVFQGGPAVLTLYASSDASPSNKIFSKSIRIPKLAANRTSKNLLSQAITIPRKSNLSLGGDYYFVVKLTLTAKKAGGASSTDATANSFEFVVTPKTSAIGK
jgi:hypothetical protein